jgi:hypothetical protein
MSLKRFPDTDEERINTVQAAIDMAELFGEKENILTIAEVHELQIFLKNYEGERMVLKQSIDDRAKAQIQYRNLFRNAQMYISHFIQVLQFTAIRNELRIEHLSLYGFEGGKELVLPDLSTEDAIMLWGENLLRGEAARMNKGGMPLYNPTIAKVRVHFELFKEIIQSLKIYRQNVFRLQSGVHETQKEAKEYIEDIWKRVEEKYHSLPIDELSEKYKKYKIRFQYYNGTQLNVFD